MSHLCWQLSKRQNIQAQRHHRFVPKTWMSSWASSSDQVLLLHKTCQNMSEAISKTRLFQWSQSILRKCIRIYQPSDLRGCSLLINCMRSTPSEVIGKFRQQVWTTHLIARQQAKDISSSWWWKTDKAASPQTAASDCNGACIFKCLSLHCHHACETFQSHSHAAGGNRFQLNVGGFFLTIWSGQDQASTTKSSHTKKSRCACDWDAQYILRIKIYLYLSITQKQQPHSQWRSLLESFWGGHPTRVELHL